MHFDHYKGFDWDAGNMHKVSKRIPLEVVESAFSKNALVAEDPLHSTNKEKRFLLINLKMLKPVFSAFTIRKNKIRVISARYMHAKEVSEYEKR